tara:strand:+ start:162 stop:338 length:177 start_codon:yes stop_codon:yes gene_type:complete
MNASPANIIAIGAQRGAVTHHQDQSMEFVNFKVIKIRNITIPNPTPLLFDFEFEFAIS